MFKIEVNVNGVTKHHYWMNKHNDDFLQFLPVQFTREYGEEILPEHITAYKIEESKMALLEGKLKQNEGNALAYEDGKILCKRLDKAKYKAGDKVRLEEYEAEAAKRDDKFKDAKDKEAVKVKAPNYKKENVVEGEETIEVDMVTIDGSEDLAQDVESLELELVGVALKEWPYDSKGRFKGNK